MTADTPYKDPLWKTVRPAVLERDSGRCQLRLPKCRGRAVAIDHVIDWRDGGAWFDLDNLRAACTSCNTAQRNTRVAARARAHRAQPQPTLHADEQARPVHGLLSWCERGCTAQHPSGTPTGWAR